MNETSALDNEVLISARAPVEAVVNQCVDLFQQQNHRDITIKAMG